MISLREKLITEEWAIIYKWMSLTPERHGHPEDFPDIHEFLDKWVPSFTDSVGLLIDGELVAAGILVDDCNVHVAANSEYENKVVLLRAIKKALVPYAKKKYRCLYTEFFSDDYESERFVKFLGFAILPIPLNKNYRQAAMITRNDTHVKHILAAQANNRKRPSGSKHRPSKSSVSQAH